MQINSAAKPVFVGVAHGNTATSCPEQTCGVFGKVAGDRCEVQHKRMQFLSDPGVPGVRSMGPDLCPRGFADLTDVTLADEDSNSIPTNDVNRAILGNLAMQVAPLGGQN